MVGARVAGTVEQLHVQLGDQVKAGEPLLTLSTDGREGVVERWRSNIRKLEADLAGARRLRSNNLASETEGLRVQSELAADKTELTSAVVAVQYLNPAAH